MASELLALGRIMAPALLSARQRARARITTALGKPTSLSRAIVSVFGSAYLDGVDAAIAVFGSELGVTRAAINNDLTRALTDRMLTAVGVAQSRALRQVELEIGGNVTVSELVSRLEAAAQSMVWQGQDEEAATIGRLAEAEWKTWVRAFARDENRDHHDDLNGVSIPIDDLFNLSGVGVYGPRDWNRLPDPGEWMNCGHALDYKMVANAEDLEPTLRDRNVVFAPARVRETEDEARAQRGLPPLRTPAPDGPFRPSD